MAVPVPRFTLYEQKDIEILLAYILSRVGNMTVNELMCSTVDRDFIMYFDFVSAIYDMRDKELITMGEDKDPVCSPTDKSNYLAAELAYTIPLSIREDTVYYAKKITARTKLEKAVKTEIIEVQNGYQLYIRFINEMGGADFMELKIYAPTYESAEDMERRVFDNPEGTYRSVINYFIQGYLTVSEAELNGTLGY